MKEKHKFIFDCNKVPRRYFQIKLSINERDESLVINK